MGCVTRSCRRKSRSRLSRSIKFSGKLSRQSGISKRKTSRFQNNAGLEAVSRELNFGGRSVRSKVRRRSDRILQKKQATSVSSSIRTDADCVGSSSKHDYEADDLAQVELVPGDENRIVESTFGEIFDNASLLKVEVEQCVSLPELRTRPLHSFGVRKAVHLLRGNSIGSVTGHVCVGKYPVIAELPSEYEERILEYFCSQGRDRETSKRYISMKKVYHVVNGGYEHAGRWKLIDESKYQFSGIKWRTVQIMWQQPKVLRAISIMSSQVQKKDMVVELSFLDELVYLRRVIQDYVNEQALVLDASRPLPRGFCKAICKAYSGGAEYSNNTLRHLVSIAAKINMRTMLMMRNTIDEECPSIARTTYKKALCEDPVHVLDTKIFRTLINSKTLRGAKAFLTAETSDEDRCNALYRLRYVAQESGCYRGADPKTLETQLEAAVAGRKSLDSFKLIILKDEPWPNGMKPLLQNILRTTKLDSDIKNIERDPDKLLEPLKMTYLECAGGEGGSRVEQYEKFVQDRMRVEISGIAIDNNHREPEARCSLVQQSPSSNRGTGELEGDSRVSASDCGSRNISLGAQPLEETTLQSSENPSKTAQTMSSPIRDSDDSSEPGPEVDILEQLNIELHGMEFEDYNRTVLTEQEVFDLVISDPFQKAASAEFQEFSSERRIAFIQFVKKVLVPGGHVFLILPQLDMSEWVEAFEDFGMKTEGVFLLLKDPEHVQRVKGKNFQNLMEVAAVARKPGRHPTRFTMDTISPYTQLQRNTYKRRAPVIDHISPPSNRLRFPGSKALVRTGEKSPALFWELMKTFCPAGGRVLDPKAATLSVGIAGIQTGRACVLLESDRKCLSLAEKRIRELATKHLEAGQEFVPTAVSDAFELQKEGDENGEDPYKQDEICLNDLQGNLEADCTMSDCADRDPEHIRSEESQSKEKEDKCEARESEACAGRVECDDEGSKSRNVHEDVGSRERSNANLQEVLSENVSASDQGIVSSPAKPINTAHEPETNAKDSGITHTLLKSIPNESEPLTPKDNEITRGHADRMLKANTDAVRGGITDPNSTVRRPQRKRKKTSRYA